MGKVFGGILLMIAIISVILILLVSVDVMEIKSTVGLWIIFVVCGIGGVIAVGFDY